MSKHILPRSFYLDEDVVGLSRALLGKVLVTKINNVVTAGVIVETEAYRGAEDKASHAYNNRLTDRTKTMFLAGGVGYVYLCYGLHHLFNIVTAGENVPHAVLIRAISPLVGIETMAKRRKMPQMNPHLTSGPGKMSQALGITKALDGCDLTKAPIWVEDHGIKIAKKAIVAGPRVGIDYAEEHRDLPWRFRLKA